LAGNEERAMRMALVMMVGGLACGTVLAQETKPVFEALCVPVVKAGLMGTLVGPGPDEGSERIYFNFRQDGGKLFLVAVDPDTGKAEQFQSPVGTGAWGFIVGPDNRIYLGTHEGPDPGDSGQILVFDPKHPEQQIQIVGRPSETETYIWMYTIGHDGKLYGCTYPQAKLVSYDPATGEMADLGRMDDVQKYTRSICTAPDGRICIGIGYGRANVVVYDPKTGEHASILPEKYRDEPNETAASVYTGTDGDAYITAGAAKLRITATGTEVVDEPPPAVSKTVFADGRAVQNPLLDGTYDQVGADGKVEKKTFEYKGAGSGVFMVSTGPLGRIYGGTAMPNEMFWYDPGTGKHENPGNPCEVGGEIYSMLDHDGILYMCAYPGSFLSKWDPEKPWNYGREPANNPRGFGRLGVGHLRPRAMIHGPNDMICIGSYPEYGKHGGSLGVWDPVQDKLVENHHHLIKNQSIVSLVYDPDSGLIYGGSSTAGGGGTNPVEPEARFFAFDPKSKGLVLEESPFPGMQSLRTLVRAGNRLFGICDGEKLFVYDLVGKEYVHKAELGVGHVPDCCMGLWKDGLLYGLSGNSAFRLDPETFEVTVLAEYEGSVRCGFAMDDHGIYFGDRATLMRFNWPGK
jgi:hypothetical protein